MLKIGITGGIGSGKSIISELLINMAYPVYISDIESKSLCNSSNELKSNLINAFGESIYEEGSLNTALFASIIFKDKSKLQLANELIHPVVRADFSQWAEKQKTKLVFIESAILFDSELINQVDKSIIVSAPEDIRIQRVVNRDGVSEELVVARIKNQLPEEKVLQKADYIIYNDDKQAVIPQLEKILSLF